MGVGARASPGSVTAGSETTHSQTTGRSPEEVPDDGVAHGVGGDLGAQLEEVLRADVGLVFGQRQQPTEEPRLPHLSTVQPEPPGVPVSTVPHTTDYC